MTIEDAMCSYLVNSRSDGTVRKCYSYFQKWKRFCEENRFNYMPVQSIHVAIYLTRLMDSQCSFSVISACAYSIKWAHSLCGKLESKKISNDQELIQSDPISCPQNQKGNN